MADGTALTVLVNWSPATTYTVPAGKQLVFSALGGNGSGAAQINGVRVNGITSVGTRPLVASAGDVVSASGASFTINGLLFDTAAGTPLTALLSATTPLTYTVPTGKQFVGSVLNGNGSNSLRINGIFVTQVNSVGVAGIIAGAGDVLSTSGQELTMNGLLYDIT